MKKFRNRNKYKKRVNSHKHNMDKRCLIVVDMQIDYPAAIIKHSNITVWNRIGKMIKHKHIIVFINYLLKKQGCNEDVPTITTYNDNNIDMLKAYMNKHPNNVIFLRKNSDDGSQIIYDEIRDRKIDVFEIIGVNTEHCVADTAIGLSHKLPNKKIAIRLEACNSNPFLGKSHSDIIDDLAYKVVTSKADNIRVMSSNKFFPDVPASHIYNSLSNEGDTNDLIEAYNRHRNNALKTKSGIDTHNFRDDSIRILVLDDVNMNLLLKHYESKNTEKIKLSGITVGELNHPYISTI